MTSSHFVKKLPRSQWNWQEEDGFGTLYVNNVVALMTSALLWQFNIRNSMVSPLRLGQTMVGWKFFPLWLYKGHLFIGSSGICEADIIKAGSRVKPYYKAKEQWWWQFSDPFLHGYMEQMDRVMLGLKQQHEANWAGLSKSARDEKKQFTRGIKVRDNRYIPQWVKIQVVLRDKGKCVYCGESNVKLLEFDHRRAWSKGGTSKDPLNICLGCKTCNRKKSDKDWGWR